MNQHGKTMYLGDGVYANHNAYRVIIFTDDGYGPKNEIALDPDVIQALQLLFQTLGYQQPAQVTEETKWAVVEVIPTLHGTDETKGVTLARGLTHIEAALYKQAYFEGVQSCGCTVEDNFTIHNPEHRLDKHYRGLLVCTEDRAP